MPGAIVHVKRRETDVSMHYPHEFVSVGDRYFERKPVEFLSDQFVNVNKANLLSIRDLTPLGDDDVPPEISLKWDADTTYNCQVYGVASPGKWITEKNADPALDYETERAIQLTLSLRLRLEYLQVKQRLRSTTYNTNQSALTAHSRFDAYSDPLSLPIKTMQTICDNLGYANNGKKPNKIDMSTHPLRAVCRSEEFKDLVKYNAIQNSADLEKSEMGQKFLVELLVGVKPGTINVADHVYNGGLPVERVPEQPHVDHLRAAVFPRHGADRGAPRIQRARPAHHQARAGLPVARGRGFHGHHQLRHGPSGLAMTVTDHSTPGNKQTVEMVVVPGGRYGSSVAGEHVLVDKRELQIPASRETLCTVKEYKQMIAEAKRLADEPKIPARQSVDSVRDSIAQQLEAAGRAAAVARRGDRRFVQPGAEE